MYIPPGSTIWDAFLTMGLGQTLRFILGHPMNRGRPISTLARFAKWQVQSRLQDEIIFDWIGGAKLAVRRGMTGATGNIYCGLHEYVDMSFVLDTLKPGDLFVDVGANVGSYTVLAARVCAARVIAVEPAPETVKSLRRNIEVNQIQDRVEIVQAALGAEEGTANLTAGRDTMNKVVGSMDETSRKIAMTTVDRILNGKAPTVLKMDVEGYEGEVLKGAKQTLSNPALKAVITETLDKSVLGFLQEAGFKKIHYDPRRREIVNTSTYASANSIMVRGSISFAALAK